MCIKNYKKYHTNVSAFLIEMAIYILENLFTSTVISQIRFQGSLVLWNDFKKCVSKEEKF